MAPKVFGNPIADETLKAIPTYANKEITPLNRAHEALKLMESRAVEHIQGLQPEYGTGMSTLCAVYNATGHTLKFIAGDDWQGCVIGAPYPTEIANGQWGTFQHVGSTLAKARSSAAVVYRGKNQAGDDCDFMFSWSTPCPPESSYKAYTEIFEAGKVPEWSKLKERTENAGQKSRADGNGCTSRASITDNTQSFYVGVVALKGVDQLAD